MSEKIEWKKLTPMDGDPYYKATLGEFDLSVEVIGEWFWRWSIESDESTDIARGSTMDIGIEDPDGVWDYQGVEVAQARCLLVAQALHEALGMPSDDPG